MYGERDGSGVGSARRRRERRLRSWWRHERTTVAAEFVVALHHNRDVGPGMHVGLRAQKTASSGGRRPGVLKEPVPPVVVECAARPCSGVPLLAIPCLGGGADGVDVTTTQFLLKKAILRKKEEEEEEEKARKEEAQEKADLELAKRDPWWAQHLAKRKAMDEQHLADMKAIEERRYKASSSSKRKRKKRRKRRTPRTSSLPGRARRRQRQWFACSAGFTGDDVPRVMIPSGVVWPKMLRIMAGMVQKDSCSGMARLVLLLTVPLVLCFLPSLQACDALHHGQYGPEGLVDAPRAVFPSLSSGPRCPFL